MTAIDGLVRTVIGLPEGSRLAETVSFFLYDSVKILLLLFVMITLIGFLRTYIPQEKVRKWLSGSRAGVGNVSAAMFGALTPFCSCSSIPIFLSFLEAGIPLGITFSFLITSPLINEYLVVIMLGLFGWKITLLYILAGLLIGTVSGMILGRMRLEKHLVRDLIAKRAKVQQETKHDGMKGRIMFGLHESVSITKKLWVWILVGVGIGAVIHNYVPQELIQGMMSTTGVFTVPIAVALGVPLYGNCAAIVPVAVALFDKGIPLGTALSFMMAMAALSLPEAIILRRAMKLRMIAIFFGIVTLGIILIGYALNALQPLVA